MREHLVRQSHSGGPITSHQLTFRLVILKTLGKFLKLGQGEKLTRRENEKNIGELTALRQENEINLPYLEISRITSCLTMINV